MKLTGTYQIDDLTVVNPIIEIKQVNDNIIDKNCSIEVIFNVENALINYSRTINGFTYVDTWEDIDVVEWVKERLKQFEA